MCYNSLPCMCECVTMVGLVCVNVLQRLALCVLMCYNSWPCVCECVTIVGLVCVNVLQQLALYV